MKPSVRNRYREDLKKALSDVQHWKTAMSKFAEGSRPYILLSVNLQKAEYRRDAAQDALRKSPKPLERRPE